MKKHLHKIAWVEPGSIAEELGLEPGDAIEEINGCLLYTSGLTDLLSMIPGVGSQLKNVDIDDSAMDSIEAIIYSMTPEERANPNILNPSRKKRIANGAGVKLQDVNKPVSYTHLDKKSSHKIKHKKIPRVYFCVMIEFTISKRKEEVKKL